MQQCSPLKRWPKQNWVWVIHNKGGNDASSDNKIWIWYWSQNVANNILYLRYKSPAMETLIFNCSSKTLYYIWYLCTLETTRRKGRLLSGLLHSHFVIFAPFEPIFWYDGRNVCYFQILEFRKISAIFGPVAVILNFQHTSLRGFQCSNQKVVRSAIL